jgi:integrase
MDTKSHRINLTQKRKAPNGKWVFYPVHWDRNKPDPRLIIINGEPASWQGGGAYFLDWREGGRKRKRAGKAPREALEAWRNATGVANGLIPEETDEPADGSIPEEAAQNSDRTSMPGITIEKGIVQYLKAVKATKGAGTYSSYETCLDWAKRHITKHLVYRLDRNDLLALFAAGREEKLKFLCTGSRDKEVSNLYWSDIDYRLCRISVTAKTELRYTPKSYEIRSVNVPKSILENLKVRQRSSPSLLVVPAASHPTRKSYGGGVDHHMLEKCKAVAFRAGLNCRHCQGTYTIKRSKTRKETVPYSCKTHPRCERWFLHKWRHTYASHMIGVLGLKGLQLAMGHDDIATTSKYLHFLGGDGIKEKVEASELARLIR